MEIQIKILRGCLNDKSPIPIYRDKANVNLSWRRRTLTHSGCNTIGAMGLNDAVRKGKRWSLNAVITPQYKRQSPCRTYRLARSFVFILRWLEKYVFKDLKILYNMLRFVQDISMIKLTNYKKQSL